MPTFTVTVTIDCETEEQAHQVAAERLSHDEDYGFEYTVGYTVSPKLEVLHVRDPDAYCDITIFTNGVESNNWTEESVDAGAGYTSTDWADRTAEVEADDTHSPAFKAATLEARNSWEDSSYITHDKED
jgi:hypothetical protein